MLSVLPGVNCLDVHPSSKLALSLGQNKTLRTWNLVKGRPAYTSNLARYLDVFGVFNVSLFSIFVRFASEKTCQMIQFQACMSKKY